MTLDYVPVENASDFTAGHRCAAAWNGNKLKVRIPWTMLYFYDPTQMKVNDGAVSYDGGYTFRHINEPSRTGLQFQYTYKGSVTSTTSRYNWDKWLVVPATVPREKKSLQVVSGRIGRFCNVCRLTDSERPY